MINSKTVFRVIVALGLYDYYIHHPWSLSALWWAFGGLGSFIICGTLSLIVIRFLFFSNHRKGKASLRGIPTPPASQNGVVAKPGEYWIDSCIYPAQIGVLNSYKEYVNKWMGIRFPFIERWLRGFIGESRGRWITKQEWLWGDTGVVYLSNFRLFFKSSQSHYFVSYNEIESYNVYADSITIATSKGSRIFRTRKNNGLWEAFETRMQLYQRRI